MTPTQRKAIGQAIDALDEAANVLTSSMFAEAAESLRNALAEPAPEPVAFLANATRFKMAFFHNEDSEGQVAEGMYVTCFEGFEDELDGRWVALVPAENSCHLNLTAPVREPAPVKPMMFMNHQDSAYVFRDDHLTASMELKRAPVPLLTDTDLDELLEPFVSPVMHMIARSIEKAVRQKAGL